MDNTEMKDSIVAAATVTFADMAFIDILEETGNAVPASFENIVYIPFSDCPRKGLALFLSADCINLVMKNIFGCASDKLTGIEINDCLLELMNVLAGNLLCNTCFLNMTITTRFIPKLITAEYEFLSLNTKEAIVFNAEGAFFKVVFYESLN